MERRPGFHEAQDGVLINLAFHDKDENGVWFGSQLYSPTEEEIKRELIKYDLPVEYCMEMIRKRDVKTHAIVLDLPRFREHLNKEGYRWSRNA